MKTKAFKILSLAAAIAVLLSALSGIGVAAEEGQTVLVDTFDEARAGQSAEQLKENMDADLTTGALTVSPITAASGGAVLDYMLTVSNQSSGPAYAIAYQTDGKIADLQVKGFTKTQRTGNTYGNPVNLNYSGSNTVLELSDDGSDWTPLSDADYTFTIGEYVDEAHAQANNGCDTTMRYTITLTDAFKEKLQNSPGYTRMCYFRISVGRGNSYRNAFEEIRLTTEPMGEITEGELLDQELVFSAFTDEPANALTKDLHLPAVAAANGNPIKWETSDPAVITAEGRIIRGSTEQTATLTAYVAYDDGYDGSATFTKSFTVTVLREGIAGMLIDPCESFDLMAGHSDHLADPTVMDDAGGETAIVVSGNDYLDGSQYLLYAVEGQAVSLAFDTVEHSTRGGEKRPRVEVSPDGSVYTELTQISREQFDYTGIKDPKWKHATYTAETLPPDTKYIKLYYGAQVDGAYWAFAFDEIRIAYDNTTYAYQWPAGAAVRADSGTATADLEWPAVTGDGEIEYEIYRNNEKIAQQAGTAYRAEGLEAGARYTFAVRAVDTQDPSAVSRLLNADELIMPRPAAERGEKLTASLDDTPSQTISGLQDNDAVSLSGEIVVSPDAVFAPDGYITAGFDDTYIKWTADRTEYYKNGALAASAARNGALGEMKRLFVTEDNRVSGETAQLELKTEGLTAGTVSWGSLEVYRVPSPADGVWLEQTGEQTITGSYTVGLDDSAPAPTLSKNFTFEMDVKVNSADSGDVNVNVYSQLDGVRLATFNLSHKNNMQFRYDRAYDQAGDKNLLRKVKHF